ncbi:hypothetical protein SSX86_028187 [Deinandra increscens subsp. villosa]|uniref:Eukaryotic translation initiation factor 3 subunit B n=1 Tax=Deinandra increscens subsp. villosa TaxID=3103831 RepID=A0AAP0CCP1_9ASTR
MVDVMTMAFDNVRSKASRLKFDLSSVILPPGEDFGIESDDEDLYEDESVEFDAGLGSIIVVDNLPVVSRDKFDKLERVVRNKFSEIGVIKENGLWMPVEEETGKTRGYCFIEYNTPHEAELAKEKKNGRKLDKKHIFAVNMFDEIDKFMKVPVEWIPPETKPYTSGENLQHWLVDKKGRDQFVIRSGSDTEILWNDARQLKADPVYKRPFWTENSVQWSPLGTYLATVDRHGAAVWGGGFTNHLMRYVHPQVKLIDFSPGEKYLVTYSIHGPINPPGTHMVALNIFDVKTGKVMKDFKGSADEFAFRVSWPILRWGGGKEDKYFAQLGKNAIYVYETETSTLIDEKSIEVEKVMDFSWSPTDSVFAIFAPELGGGNQPARVSLFQIPSKVELRQKNLFNVSDCKLYWQSNGEYLAAKVERYTKAKKSTYTSFELFRTKERDIPIEVFELDNKNDKVTLFAWEPKGHRFAVIHGDNPRYDVSFYTVKGGKVSKLTTLKQKQANALFWSPGGRFIILAGLKGFNGQLEFYNVDDLETMTTTEHFMATDVEWDPTGRYVATSVTSAHEMENGFNIWSFNGKLLYRVPKDHLLQFLWRPRPPSLLSPEKEEEIFKNLKEYTKRYEIEDQGILVLLSEQEREIRSQLKEEWEQRVNEWKRDHEEDEEEQEEELLDVTEEILDP